MNQILIVDDESDTRKFLANFFRKRKIDTFTASGGEEALAIFDKENPAIVLLDIIMGGMDGVEVLKRLKEKNKSACVIMVTGKNPDQEIVKKCKELGAHAYIHKPLELDELEKQVLSLM
jgi:two-component system response regulator (stage 0 sporulation protein F)